MTDQTLRLPPSERSFWSQVAARWVMHPGLLIAVVPSDQNDETLGRLARDLACQSGAVEALNYVSLPDRRDTFCYDLSDHDKPLALGGRLVLEQSLAETERLEVATSACRGEGAFFFLVSGIAVPSGTSLTSWAREIVNVWPFGNAGRSGSQLHVCVVATAALPAANTHLPEGCDWILSDTPSREEVALAMAPEVEIIWPREPAETRRFICSAIADMSSGRRPHADLALQHLEHELGREGSITENWLPCWPQNCSSVVEAKAILAHVGIDENWAHQNNVIRGPMPLVARQEITARLWSNGLWSGDLLETGFWNGLTTLARTALLTYVASGSETVDAFGVSGASIFVMKRCLEVEHTLRIWLRQAITSHRARVRLARVIDADPPQKQPGGNSHTDNRFKLGSGHPWNQGNPSTVEEVLATCSLGYLRRLFLGLLSKNHRDFVAEPLRQITEARNRAAHGGRFNLGEYRHICSQLDSVELALVRVGAT